MKPDYPLVWNLVGLEFSCDEEKLKNLSIQPTEIATEDLSWHLSVPFLVSRGTMNKLNPLEVIKYPHAHEEEHARAKHADLTNPIDIVYAGDRWVILDGLHRLMKAHMLQRPTILVRKIPISEIPNISK